MIDLTAIDEQTIIARGQYATVRSAHEDAKKHLAVLCGQLSSAAGQVLRHMQPDNDGSPDMAAVNALLSAGRQLVDNIAASVAEIEGLAMQRAALKATAWGRP